MCSDDPKLEIDQLIIKYLVCAATDHIPGMEYWRIKENRAAYIFFWGGEGVGVQFAFYEVVLEFIINLLDK